MLALLAALAAAALFSTRPWEDDGVVPAVTLAPGIGAGIEDAVPLAPGRQVAVAQAIPAPIGVAVMASRPVPVIDDAPAPAPRIALASAEPVGPIGLEGPIKPAPPAPAPETPAQPVLVSPPPASSAPAPETETRTQTRLVANFENGLDGWSTAPTGNIPPRVKRGIVRDGENATVVRLAGEESRSQLILGGDGGSGGAVQILPGDEYAFSFSVYVESMVYGEPGADNVLLQFMSDASDTRTFGLQFLQAAVGDPLGVGRGLWASGDAMGGYRFLAPLAHRAWHDIAIHFLAANDGTGFYELYVDGDLVDSRTGVSLISPGSSSAQIEVGLVRDPTRVQGTSEIRLDAASLEPVQG